MTRRLWISTPKFTAAVTAQNNYVVEAAPILRKFVGQPWINLQRWFRIQSTPRRVVTLWKEEVCFKYYAAAGAG